MAKTSYASCDQVIFVDQVASASLSSDAVLVKVDCGWTYGDRGRGYIECHHVVPLHAAGNQTDQPRLVLLYRSQIQLHTGSSTT